MATEDSYFPAQMSNTCNSKNLSAYKVCFRSCKHFHSKSNICRFVRVPPGHSGVAFINSKYWTRVEMSAIVLHTILQSIHHSTKGFVIFLTDQWPALKRFMIIKFYLNLQHTFTIITYAPSYLSKECKFYKAGFHSIGMTPKL